MDEFHHFQRMVSFYIRPPSPEEDAPAPTATESPPPPVLLDNAPSHPPAEDLVHKTRDGEITVLYLPPNTTSILQPMDQGPIEATKRLYRKELVSSIVSDDAPLSATIKSLTILSVIRMASKAWSDVKTEALLKSWKKTGVHDAPDEEDEEDDQDPVAELQQVLQQVPGPQLSNSEVADWLGNCGKK